MRRMASRSSLQVAAGMGDGLMVEVGELGE
jgi:hypothetical protein